MLLALRVKSGQRASVDAAAPAVSRQHRVRGLYNNRIIHIKICELCGELDLGRKACSERASVPSSA
jgi:hypothetical protein